MPPFWTLFPDSDPFPACCILDTLPASTGEGRSIHLDALDFERQAIRDRQPLRDRVHRYLRDGILSGRYSFGQRLAELEVAAELQLSRTPVREAFRKLELEGLVRYEVGRGVTVTYLGPRDMPELYEIMVALEGMAARLAARRISPEAGEALQASLEAVEGALDRGDVEAAREAHERFNDQIFRSAGNRRLYELLTRFAGYIERTRSVSWPARIEEIRADHRALVEAIRGGDLDRAEQVMREHVDRSRQTYLRALGEGDEAGARGSGA